MEKILSHLIAFAFHTKAYSERIESLQHDLNVIDHLRNYRPKRQPHRTAVHRSVFSGFPSLMTGTPGLERVGFNWGFGGTLDGRQSRPDTPNATDDEGHAGDTEGLGSNPRKQDFRKSWGLTSTFSWKKTTASTNDRHRPSPADQPYINSDLDSYPPKPQDELRSSGQSTPMQRHSEEEEEALVVQAARAIKHAVLHDARNIKGKEPGNSGLGWDVTSSREAKV